MGEHTVARPHAIEHLLSAHVARHGGVGAGRARVRGGPAAQRRAEADVVMFYHDALNRYRCALVRAALIRSGGNRAHAAAALGIERTYMLKLIRTFQSDAIRNGHRRVA